MTKKITSNSIFYLVIAGLGLLFLAPFLILTLYNHPSADDFPLTHTARDWGTYTSVVGYYKCWSSRYTSIFLMSINPLVFDSLNGYKLCTPLIFGIIVFSIRFFLNQAIAFTSKLQSWIASMVYVLVLIGTAPSLVEGFYYMGGAFFYQSGNAIMVLIAGSLLLHPPKEKWLPLEWKSSFWLGVQATLVFLLGGCNEMTMMFGMAMIGMCWLYSIIQTRKIHAGWTILFFSSAFATWLVLSSPATFFRMQASGGFVRSKTDALIAATTQVGTSLSEWLTIPAFVFLMWTIFSLPVTKKIPQISKIYARMFSAISVFLFLFCFVPSFLGEGFLQGRTANGLQFIFLFLFVLNVVFWKRTSVENISGEERKFYLRPEFSLLVCVVFLFFSPNFLLAFDDLKTGEAKEYSDQRDARIIRMQTTQGDSVWIPAVTHKPKSIFYGDIGDYPNPWYDNHFAGLFDKVFVHLDDSSSRKKQKIK